ncbi:MAG: hypothetical protein WDM90_05705 [Ferruginibacter sp.]
MDYGLKYMPGESDNGMYGGNSNWAWASVDAAELFNRSFFKKHGLFLSR